MTAARLTCWSCDKYATGGIQCQRDGWPDIGQRCVEFSYEPGTSPAEFEDEYEYYANQSVKHITRARVHGK